MTALTVRQIEVLRRIGAAVDELALRNQAARRSLEAVREQRRRLQDRVRKIDRDIESHQLAYRASVDPGAAAELKKLRGEHQVLEAQIAAAERQQEETSHELSQLTGFSAPLTATFEGVLRYARLSPADIGVAFGSEIPRAVQADIILNERPA